METARAQLAEQNVTFLYINTVISGHQCTVCVMLKHCSDMAMVRAIHTALISERQRQDKGMVRKKQGRVSEKQ